jgi:hypothetical protein
MLRLNANTVRVARSSSRSSRSFSRAARTSGGVTSRRLRAGRGAERRARGEGLRAWGTAAPVSRGGYAAQPARTAALQAQRAMAVSRTSDGVASAASLGPNGGRGRCGGRGRRHAPVRCARAPARCARAPACCGYGCGCGCTQQNAEDWLQIISGNGAGVCSAGQQSAHAAQIAGARATRRPRVPSNAPAVAPLIFAAAFPVPALAVAAPAGVPGLLPAILGRWRLPVHCRLKQRVLVRYLHYGAAQDGHARAGEPRLGWPAERCE